MTSRTVSLCMICALRKTMHDQRFILNLITKSIFQFERLCVSCSNNARLSYYGNSYFELYLLPGLWFYNHACVAISDCQGVSLHVLIFL